MTRQEIERHDSYLSLRKQGVSWAEIGYGDSISADAARCWFNRHRNQENLFVDGHGYAYSQQLESHLVKQFADTEKEAVIDTFENAEKKEREIDAIESIIGIGSLEHLTPEVRDAYAAIWTGHQYEEKKTGSVEWRELFEHADRTNQIRSKASSNNTLLNLDYHERDTLHFINLGDLHLFSGGTNHKAIETLTDRIRGNPNLGVVLLGDVLENAINMRSVAEVQGQSSSAALQLKALESWLFEIKDRILFSTHDNHSSERFEKAAGVDFYGWIMSKVCPFFDGIGVAKIKVGSQEYKVGATHKLRGKSMNDPTYGHKRYMRFDDQSLDVMLAGDSHKYGISHYDDGGRQRLAVNCGTANTNSAYAKRYFSLYSMPVFPVVTLYGDVKEFNAFPSIISWEKAHGNK